MIPGLESVSKYNDDNRFDILVKKFKQDLSKKIHQTLKGTQSIELLEQKVDMILGPENFYAFKIFPG